METKLIKTEVGYNLFTQGFLKASTEIDLINQMNIEEGNIRYHLSKQNCNEIFGMINVENLSEDFAKNHSIYPTAQDDTEYGFKHGFNKAMELNKDKVFTLEDMGNLWDFCTYNKGTFAEFIQSLQQPTEIDVEIEMIKEEYTFTPNGEGFEDQTYRSWNEVPKIDSDGFLILRKL
jgi:hypothetical protein